MAYYAEAGFGFQTRELSRRIGVSQPLLYRYFPSKQYLVAAVFDEVFLSQLDHGWVRCLKDRSLPLRKRLLQFHTQYAIDLFLHGAQKVYPSLLNQPPAKRSKTA